MSNINNILYKNIDVLRKQVEEKEKVIKQLRKEISILKQVEANNKWVELDA
jgi:hypothetical protein|tara:strand:- start:134 stop:286 length:153 start_codon:yes stop_codon:yes gene_type:complete